MDIQSISIEFLAWGLTLILFMVGLVGTVVPGLPGQILIALGVGVHWLILREDSHLGLISLICVPLLWVAGQAVEWFASASGVKAKGGSKLAMLGAFIGSFVGLFAGGILIPLPIVGSLVGMVLCAGAGAFLAEVVVHKKELSNAGAIGVSASVAAVLGLLAGLLLGGLMILVFIIDRIG